MDKDSYQVIVVGAGPAGLVCAKILHQAGIDYLLMDKQPPGGALLCDYEFKVGSTWLSSLEYSKKLCSFPVRYCMGEVVRIERQGLRWAVVTKDAVHVGDVVVIATGVTHRTGGNVDSERVIVGPFKRAYQYHYAGKSVAVLGGGDNAFEYAALARNRGATKVDIYSRTVRARPELIEEASRLGAMLRSENEISLIDVSDDVIVNDTHYDAALVMYGFEGVELSIASDILPRNGQKRFLVGKGGELNVYVIGDCCEGELSIEKAENDGKVCGETIVRRLG